MHTIVTKTILNAVWHTRWNLPSMISTRPLAGFVDPCHVPSSVILIVVAASEVPSDM